VSRLQPLPYPEWDLPALADASPGMTPPPLNVLELFAHHPALAKAFLSYNRYLTGRASSVPARVRELAVLRVAWRRRCRYEWAQHVRSARKAGVTGEEIAAIRAGGSAGSWGDNPPVPPRGAAGGGTAGLISRAVDELDGDSRLSDETYQGLAALFDERQLMELVFTVGTYALLAMAFNTFGLELDPGLDDEGFDTYDLTPQKGT
jgi:AhpD family alkylhydroperoxidase